MLGALTSLTGGGGLSTSSSATSGDAFSGAGSVNVGGFNPPAFGGGGGQIGALGIVAALVLLYLVLNK